MTTITPNPSVSVIIPAYNQGPLLARAIDSALGQSYPPLEVIVVNDGSPDPITRATAARYEGRVVYLEQANGGVAAARNTGIAAAHGDLIALLDQDDIWLPEKLAVEVAAFARHPQVALVHSSYYLIDGAGRRTGVARLPQREWAPLPDLLLEIPIASCTALFPRRVLDEVGSFDPALAGSDDWDLWLRMAARGYRFYCLGVPLAEYRIHPANTSNDIDLMIRAGLGVLDKFYTLPNLPASACPMRDKAYFGRHAWAAALYYGAQRLEPAGTHLRAAATHDPSGVVTGRFLQSLIYARSSQPTRATALAAIRFVQQTLAAAGISPARMKWLRARARLVWALHTGGSVRRAIALAHALLAEPRLLIDPHLWAAARRLLQRAVSRSQLMVHSNRRAAK
jgi:glycosyltransferase involved in cell wall biosynthesis